jgi:hypothetical protein
MQVFWEDGAFSHVRLVVHADRSDRTWGSLPSDVDYRDEFAVETLQLDY